MLVGQRMTRTELSLTAELARTAMTHLVTFAILAFASAAAL